MSCEEFPSLFSLLSLLLNPVYKYQKLPDLFNWFTLSRSNVPLFQPTIPSLEVSRDMPTYLSQSWTIGSKYWYSINSAVISNLLYRTTDSPIQPVIIKFVFLHLFIIIVECIYMSFIRSQRNILTIICMPVKHDFYIPKVYLWCVFNLWLHFGEHSMLMSGAGCSVGSYKSLYYSISTNWEQ